MWVEDRWGCFKKIQTNSKESMGLLTIEIPTHHIKFFQLLTSRYGLREGFKNVLLKQVHDASTKFMDVTSVNVHENVPQYEEVGVPTVRC
jgi:hypothetical protein